MFKYVINKIKKKKDIKNRELLYTVQQELLFKIDDETSTVDTSRMEKFKKKRNKIYYQNILNPYENKIPLPAKNSHMNNVRYVKGITTSGERFIAGIFPHTLKKDNGYLHSYLEGFIVQEYISNYNKFIYMEPSSRPGINNEIEVDLKNISYDVTDMELQFFKTVKDYYTLLDNNCNDFIDIPMKLIDKKDIFTNRGMFREFSDIFLNI